MKIKIDMKKTYKITLPKGAKVYHTITQPVNGILEVTVNMEQKYVPKDGDIVYAQWEKDGRNYKWVFIYKKSQENPYEFSEEYTSLGIEENGEPISVLCFDGYSDAQQLLRPATEAEKQRLFDALAKQGKRWNAEKKQIENLPRLRAEKGGLYYIVNNDLTTLQYKDYGERSDMVLHDVGNYFRTREAAEKVAEQIRDIFKNSKAE